MLFQIPNLERSSIQADLVCRSLANHVKTSHTTTFRFIFWQRQFRLLSSDSSTWSETWNGFHETYTALINENGLNNFLQSSSDGSIDQLVFHAIHIDVLRLSRYFNIFCEDEEECRQYMKRLERILILFAQYNSANGYNQGYHELLTVLYYVAMKGSTEFGLAVDECEAVAYFMLHGLINGTIVGDFFMNDPNSSALITLCQQTKDMLKLYDPVLATSLSSNNISPVLFALSWINVLFTQVYMLPHILLLWDFLFSDIDNLQNNLLYLVVAHIISIRNQLIGLQFAQMMIMLSHLQVQTETQFVDICRHLHKVRRACHT
jgi:hypothetical protein